MRKEALMMVRSDVLTSKTVSQQCQDYRLTTAEVLYCVQDFPDLLQSFLWQGLDMIPDFPKFNTFLNCLEENFDGCIKSARIGYVGVISEEEWNDVFSRYDRMH